MTKRTKLCPSTKVQCKYIWKSKFNEPQQKQTPQKNLNERLRSLSPANWRPKQGIIWSRNHLKTDLSSIYKYQRENYQEEQKKSKNPTHVQIQKTSLCLCFSRGPKRKHRADQLHKLYQTNNGNFIKLWKTLEDTIRFQYDPAGQVINLSTKRFYKDTFKLLNKNLNFVPAQKIYQQRYNNKQFEDFLDK